MMSRSDTKFLVQYMRWRMDKPRTFSVMDSRTVSGYRKHSGREFPRSLVMSPDGRILVLANYGSGSLQIMDSLRLLINKIGK